MKIRRTEFLFFYHTSQKIPDLCHIYGQKVLNKDQVYAIPVLLGSEIIIEKKYFPLLMAIPTDKWTEQDQIPIMPTDLDNFVAHGILLSDDPENEKARIFLQFDQILKNQQWNIYGALYYFMSKWRDVDINAPFTLFQAQKELPGYLKALNFPDSNNEPPPDHFHEKGIAGKSISLDSNFKESKFFKTLKKRKTTRNFDPNKKLKKKKLSKLLHYVFGAQGICQFNPSLSLLKKTSPSPGSLHATEVYLLVLNVKGIPPGIYHYNVRSHQLFPIREYELEEAKDMAKKFAAGQGYVADANVLFLLSNRFYRHAFKYKKHPKSISNIFMEAAHYGQTFYLTCAEMGLGAFTTVMNNINVEEALEISGVDEGAILLLGCGHSSKNKEKKYPEYNFET